MGKLFAEGGAMAPNAPPQLRHWRVSDIWSRNFFPKRSLLSFWRTSDFVFNNDIAFDKLSIALPNKLSLMWYETAVLVWPTRSKLFGQTSANPLKQLLNLHPLLLPVSKNATVFSIDPWNTFVAYFRNT